MFDFDFSIFDIKGWGVVGNILICYFVWKIILKEVGKFILGVIKVWMDEVSGWLNILDWGIFFGVFDIGDILLVIYKFGEY